MFFRGSGGGAGDNSNYEQYREEMRQRREAAVAGARKQQAEIDAVEDPQEKKKLNRQRYRCGEGFVEIEQIPSWAEAGPKLIALTDNTSMRDKPAGSGRGGFMMMRNDTVKLTEADLQQRYLRDDSLNSKISVFQGDITSLEVDGIVNAANSSLMGGGGIDGAIHSAAGNLLVTECETLGGCETGNTKITKGYALPAAHVLHTVGPIGGGNKKLRGCYQSCLDLVKEHKLKSIAFCCVSTGIFGFPLERATHIALTVVREWLQDPENAKQIDRIIFCTFRDVEMESYERLLPFYFPLEGLPAGDQITTVETLARSTIDWDEEEPERGGGGGFMF